MEKIRLVIFLLVALPLVSTRNVRKDFSADSKESFPPRHRVNKYDTLYFSNTCFVLDKKEAIFALAKTNRFRFRALDNVLVTIRVKP